LPPRPVAAGTVVSNLSTSASLLPFYAAEKLRLIDKHTPSDSLERSCESIGFFIEDQMA
jgi:hypothetical protein